MGSSDDRGDRDQSLHSPAHRRYHAPLHDGCGPAGRAALLLRRAGRQGGAALAGADPVSPPYLRMLDSLTRLRGIRGAMVVSIEDGLVVAESLMAGIKGAPLAALSATLAGRVGELTGSAGYGGPRFLHLQGHDGALLVAPAHGDLLLVAVAGRD